MIKFKSKYIAVILCLYLPVEAAYYRWTDDNGKTHYSYSVPASKSQLGHVVISKQGIETEKVMSAEKKRQIKELADLRAMKKLQADKENKIKEFQAAEDNLLLSVFSSEKELVKAYDSKLQLAQVTIDLLKGRHKKQSIKLEVLEQKHERMVDIKHKQALEKQIDVVLDNLKIYQQAITENLIEKDKVKGEFETTLARFQKLMVKPASE
ncbi:DUF4124 domain-containing protein [Cocleimonas sp. KMM 6892]|uniref:DUF4124 domain-containing protein n=1 Tax=unclassified Cocleimonas TaxID=2639732 RepID=UPI002DB6C305|nr:MULTISPECIES: DUF4124 domain-containing protein [unclassified Cocleimonas]MEB8432218.1 DUF4124 domain-containing protein [Cocleimonas sp. KMM 6892]MEC4714696.1 DUF4124 domain-containing protein [Cocleimonas sp. KMM 6895]MEC4744490.1 DUF4124 domain-containing protein [Cocleimonas sp. KMM 6896]